MKNNKLKRNSGITLIALVITIIVMLILVAVTTAVAVNGGLFEYAGRAGAKTNEAIDEEQLLASGKIKVNEIWYDSIDAYIAGEKAFESWPDLAELSDEELEKLLDETTGMLTENTKYTDTNKKVAVIPKGFMLTDVEDEIDKGIVISDEVDSQGNSIGNEYVWVPVEDGTLDREQWFIDNMTGSEFITNMNNGEYTVDELIEYLATYYAIKKMYKETLEEALVSKSIIEDVSDSYTTENLKTFISGLTYFKGDIESEDDIKTALTGICTLSTSTYTETLTTELVASVAKYKGFYIARYEAGSEAPRTSAGKNTLTEVITKQGLYPYNFVSQTKAITKIGEMYSDKNTYGVVATLPYGAQWDETMKFVKTEKDVTNSTAWGNYKDNTFDFTGEYTATPDVASSWDDDETEKPAGSDWLLTTGACDENQAKNIYDLAGNVWEWTMEAGSSAHRVTRSGIYSYYGGYYPASHRYNSHFPTVSNNSIGFRPALYIK